MKHEPELIDLIKEGIPEKVIAEKLCLSQRVVQRKIQKLRQSHQAVNNANLVWKVLTNGNFVKLS